MIEKIGYVEFSIIPREQRRIELAGCNKRGWGYKVGSLFPGGQGMEYATNVFRNVILPDAKQCGVATVFQKAGALPEIGMNQEPYFHPRVGLVIDEHGQIVLAPGTTAENVVSRVSGGIDFDPEALPSWYVIQQHEDELRKAGLRVLKTQLTSMQCARFNLSTEVGAIQEEIMASLAVTHLTKAASMAPLVCVSIDNPNPDVLEGLKRDLNLMLGMEWDGDEINNRGLLDAMNLVVALHCCEGYEMLVAMKLGVDLVHGNFANYKPENLLRGDGQILIKYLSEHGLIGVGVIPQAEGGIVNLAEKMGIFIPPPKQRYPALIDQLKQNGSVVKKVTDNYRRVIDFIKKSTGLPEDQIISQCVPSFECGFGGTKHAEVVNFSLDLAQKVSSKIHGLL